jgi:hypothetical protein
MTGSGTRLPSNKVKHVVVAHVLGCGVDSALHGHPTAKEFINEPCGEKQCVGRADPLVMEYKFDVRVLHRERGECTCRRDAR